MTTPLVLTVAAYGLLALLLLSVNMLSRWRWWIKAGIIVVTIAVFATTYFLISGMMGWPASEPLPQRFALLNTQVVDPDKLTNNPGVIYMWVQEIDEKQRPLSPPRAYQFPYTPSLLRSVADGQDQLDQGQQVLGTVSAPMQKTGGENGEAGEDKTQVRSGQGQTATGNKRGAGAAGASGFEGGQSVSFTTMPAPDLPPKAPLPAR